MRAGSFRTGASCSVLESRASAWRAIDFDDSVWPSGDGIASLWEAVPGQTAHPGNDAEARYVVTADEVGKLLRLRVWAE